MRAMVRQFERDRAANARARSRYQSALIPKIFHFPIGTETTASSINPHRI
jgi:hypothetical protein